MLVLTWQSMRYGAFNPFVELCCSFSFITVRPVSYHRNLNNFSRLS